MRLKLHDQSYSICKLANTDKISDIIKLDGFVAFTKTDKELSLVCKSACSNADLIEQDTGWSLIEIEGPLDFSMTGVLSTITEPLAKAEISLFAISTFDTDYFLVKTSSVAATILCLKKSGHIFV